MGIRKATVNFVMKGICDLICKVDCREYIDALSKNKPSIMIFNHINFLEVVILLTHCYPIKLVGLAKAETWKNPILAFLFNTYKAIPIDRNGAFSESFKKVRKTIEKGSYVCIAPEGTRSKNGVLQKGKAGIIQLAIDANMPIIPVAHHGGEQIWKNIKRFKRTPFKISAGRPFHIKFDGRPGREEREIILTEVMTQLALLLPEKMRGAYAQTQNEYKYLDFI